MIKYYLQEFLGKLYCYLPQQHITYIVTANLKITLHHIKNKFITKFDQLVYQQKIFSAFKSKTSRNRLCLLVIPMC